MRQTRSMEKERRENNKNNKRKGKEHTEKEEAEPELKKQKEPPDKGLKRGNDIIKGYQTRSKGRKYDCKEVDKGNEIRYNTCKMMTTM